ncbi:hypothetical protein INR49_003755, partial [Caranx melampygus]
METPPPPLVHQSPEIVINSSLAHAPPVCSPSFSVVMLFPSSGAMLEGYSPVTQALLGTLFTWGLTAAGSALVFVFSSRQKRILDGSLGFAAGVMLAASYWSLLAPAIDMAEDSGKYGSFAFVPVAVGFTLGAAFVYFADLAMPLLGVGADPHIALALPPDSKMTKEKEEQHPFQFQDSDEMTIRI